jgi:hypothetical protein
MKSSDRLDQRPCGRVSRRQFLERTGFGILAALSGVSGAASDETLPAARFLLEWGRRGNGEGQFDACVGIAIGKNDEVYTAKFRNQRVQKFTAEGRFLSAFPVQPHAGGLAVDEEGNVYVAHWNSNKVAVYSPGGELRREWGRKGTADVGHV